MDYFYSAAKYRSRGVLWPIFTPALILMWHSDIRTTMAIYDNVVTDEVGEAGVRVAKMAFATP